VQLEKQLKHLLILISRLLAILFLVLTFCQPFIPLKNKSQQNTGNVICIYIDNSFSMSQLGTEGQLLSQAKEQAKKIILEAKNNGYSREQIISKFEEKGWKKSEVIQVLDATINK
jgi:hypothetical protein